MKKFQRSSNERRVAGLFGGLGDSFGIDPAYLRLAFILIALVTGVIPALIAYGLGWMITPEGPTGADAGGPPGEPRPGNGAEGEAGRGTD